MRASVLVAAGVKAYALIVSNAMLGVTRSDVAAAASA